MLFNGRFQIEEVNLCLHRCGEQLKGLKIIQLSDLHIGNFGPREQSLIEEINRRSPDFIFLTGDLVPAYKNEFSACLRMLRSLKSRSGIYAVLGNADHTIRPRERFEDFLIGIEKSGIILLRNRNVQLSYKGNTLALAGVDDPFLQYDNFDQAVDGLSYDEPTILLSHSPDILFRRGDALVMNLLEETGKKDSSKNWGWTTTTYFSPETGEVFFERDGCHTVRIQSRQHGVSLDTLLLNPYPELDDLLRSNQATAIEQILRTRQIPDKYAGLVIIDASSVAESHCHGHWKKCRDRETLFGCRLEDGPARRGWRYQPLPEPEDYFEVGCTAKSNTKYRIWVRMKALNGSPYADSVYLQFSDAIDGAGRGRYRIGVPASSKSGLESIDLILAGHTHGGQIRLPFYGAVETLTSIGKKYAAGLHQIGQSLLYISRGVGYSRVPIRFLCPPEVTVFNFD
jgi:predicted MPP superfamily phosphohydrolase